MNTAWLRPEPGDRLSAVGLLSLTAVLAPVACARGWPPGAGADWVALRSENFLVYTNTDPDRHDEVVQELEALHAALTAGFFPNTQLRDTEVVVFPTDVAESRLVGPADRPTTRHDADAPMVLTVKNVRWGGNPHSTLLREMAVRGIFHRMLVHNMRRAPAWFITGLEMFVETVEIRGNRARFGHHLPRTFPYLTRNRFLPLAQLIGAPASAYYEGSQPASYQSSAWAFMHYLLTYRGLALRRRFDAIADALITGDDAGPELSRTAVARAFPDVDMTTLEGRVRDYVAKEILGKPYARTMTVELARAPRGDYSRQPADPSRLQEVLALVRAGASDHFRAYRVPGKPATP